MDQTTLSRSVERLLTAESILRETYPALQNPKLLLNAIEHIFLSMDYAMNELLSLRNKPLEKTFLARFHAFRASVAREQKIPTEDLVALKELRDILYLHKMSPVVFVRGNALVICDANYNLTTITEQSALQYYAHAQSFLSKAKSVLGEQPLSNTSTFQRI
jgi:hypothetical protein